MKRCLSIVAGKKVLIVAITMLSFNIIGILSFGISPVCADVDYILYDDFNDGVINTSLWHAQIENSGIYVEEDGVAKTRITGQYSWVYFNTKQNMKGRNIKIRVANVGGPTNANAYIGLSSFAAIIDYYPEFLIDNRGWLYPTAINGISWGSGDIIELRWVDDTTVEYYNNNALGGTFHGLSKNEYYFSFGVPAGDIGINRFLEVDYVEIACVAGSGDACDNAGLDDGLIAYWPFDEDALDKVGNHHGTVYGDTILSEGKVGKSYYFDGAGDYIQVSPNLNQDLNNSPLTWAMWIKATALPNFPPSNSADVLTNDIHCMPTRFTFSDQTKIGFAAYRGCFDGDGIGASITLDEWYHVAMTIGSNLMTLYVNGQLIDTINFSYNDIDSLDGSFKIGGNNRLRRYFTGYLDDIRIYNRALSEAEINALYNNNNLRITDIQVIPNSLEPGNSASIAVMVKNGNNAKGSYAFTTVIDSLGNETDLGYQSYYFEPMEKKIFDFNYSVPINGEIGLYKISTQLYENCTTSCSNPISSEYTMINAFEVTNDADTVPPAEISDLTASTGSNRGEIQLYWTATGDDAMSGKASKYIVRYATVPITEVNWGNTQTYKQIWTPATSGTSEAKILNGLTPGQDYYLAMKALDDASLSSNLSNVATATTSSAQGVDPVPIGNNYEVIADNITYINASEVVASGNVSLNEQLYFTGDVHINLSTLIIQGNGNVFIPNIPLMGDVYLFENGFEFDLSALITSSLESISQVAGIDLEIEEMEFLWNGLQPDGVKITAIVRLPDYLASGEININELEISRTNGISGSIDIPADDYIQIKGSKWKLTKSENNPTEPLMEFDSQSGKFKGQARLVMAKFELEASISFIEGQLYGIGICYGFPEPGKVILVIPPPTGPIPIVYLQEICGAVENIPNPKTLILRATSDISAGPKIKDYYLVGLDNSGLELDISSRATLSGTLVLGGSYDLAYAEAFIDWHDKVFGANGEMNALNIFTAQASFLIDAELNIAGRADGNLYVPDKWYYWPLRGKQGVTALGLLDNNGIKGQVQIAGTSWLSAAFGFDWKGNFDVARNIESLDTQQLSAQGLFLRLLDNQLLTANIPAGAEVIYIKVRWTGEGSATVDLIKPDDSRIAPSDCSTNADVYCEQGQKEFWYALHNPAAGQWQVDIHEIADLGDITLEVLSGNSQPFIQLTEPSTDTSTTTSLQITWLDSDVDDNATISLWYDTDSQGYDGSLIVDGLTEDHTADAYTWNLTTIPTGRYYIFAQIDDGKNAPVRSYASGMVEVINPDYPATPANLQATFNGALAELSWDTVSGCTYTVYYTENISGDSYENYFSLTEDNHWIVDGSLAGKEIKFAVQAVDSELQASLVSASITVTVPSRPQIFTGIGIIEFGDVNPATLSTKAISIKNAGNTNLVITCLKFIGQDQSAFSVNKSCPFTIAPGAQEQVEIILHPNKHGKYVSTFQIVSNDPQSEINEISLSATLNYLGENDVEAFVTRFYQSCLSRDPDPAGLDGWVSALFDGTKTGADVARGFILSQEFINQNTTNEEYLTVLYEAFFNRQPDHGGWAGWLAELNSGTDREDVLNGFIYATEFANLCDEYGIKAFEGHITKAQREAVEAFVTRFYQLCVDRDPDLAGLEGWTNNLLNQIQTGADVAAGFIYSQEFINKNKTNEEYLTILYNAFFNRDPDQGGWDAWISELNAGKDRGYVLNGFLYSQEFFNLCEEYGITPN